MAKFSLRPLVQILFLCATFASTPAHSASAPAQLRGKTINLAWSDNRVEKVIASGRERSIAQSSTVKVYISTEGHFFTQFGRVATAGSHAHANVSDLKEVSGSGSTLNWHVEGLNVTADQKFWRGARRLIVTFDSGFSSCSLRVLHGKEAGLASIQYMTFNSREPVELTSINVTSTNCSVATGNSFAQ
jgi:hypothetical protein